MDWMRRIGVRLLLVGIWTVSLLGMVYPARVWAQYDGGNVHTVAAGQTLNQIARQYGTDVQTLLGLNDITDPNLIHAGQQLIVSGRGYQTQARNESPASSTQESSYYPAGTSWEPSASQGNQQRAGVAWEPESSGASYSNNTSESYYSRPGVASAPPTSQDNYGYAAANWGAQSNEGNGYPAGTSWEPQPEPGSRRAAELTGEKWIDINLSDQVLTAYQGDTAVRSFLISSGKSSTPTVTGSFRIYSRTEMQDMSGGSEAAGDYYYVPDVPWVQYFYQDYAIHGAYWHSLFGTPVGHGCVNMRVGDSQWLYEWTGTTGARVEVHH